MAGHADALVGIYFVLVGTLVAVPVGVRAGAAVRNRLTGQSDRRPSDYALSILGSFIGLAAAFVASYYRVPIGEAMIYASGPAGAAVVVVAVNWLRFRTWKAPIEMPVKRSSQTGHEEAYRATKIELGLPDNLELFDRGSHIEIVRKWFGVQFILLTAFAVFWDGFLIFWYSVAFRTGNPITIVFPLIHVGVGFFITYYVLAGWMNRTYILVSHEKIAVVHRPIPWFGSKELGTSTIRQLYTKQKSGNNRRITYEVRVITSAGRELSLLAGVDKSEQALYIEQEIEKYLGIEDIPVRGQIN